MVFKKQSNRLFYYFAMIAVLVGLYLTTFVNYLLFHGLSEIFSIVVAFSFFTITWNSKEYIKNQYLLFIGIAYLFIAFLDLLHTLSYPGMNIFLDYDYYANQLWIGARYFESITLLIAFYFLGNTKRLKSGKIFIIYTGITSILVMSIFVWKIFPICFIEETGLTNFKKISEYAICLILLSAMGLLYKRKNKFEPYIYKLLRNSLMCTILSELAFTFYINNYGISNLVGHYFKLFSFYLIYRAIIQTGIRKPYDLIFKELDIVNQRLTQEISVRKKTEQERESLISELQTALSEIKTLSGLLPICSHCKKIRDDKGYWNHIDTYITNHSEATLSHSICQDCAKEHYPDYDVYDK